MSVDLILGLVILAQLGIIYGLTQRLIRQAGQPRMRPGDAMPDALRDPQQGGAVEKTPRQITHSFKVGL